MTFIGFFIGAVLGVFTAYRRKGNWMDLLHYGVIFGIAVALVFFIVNIVILRNM